MKLLILTQSADKHDRVLGFFHAWIEALAKEYEKVTVIALGVGNYSLPENVTVFSLGKEKGRSRLKYLYNFYRYIVKEHDEYDAVFVHMNEEYVLLGWLLWRLMRKKIYLWRNHTGGGWVIHIAALLSDACFATSKYSYIAKHFKKTVLMPVGVDTEKFKSQDESRREDRSILLFGRISPVKQVMRMVDIAERLKKESVPFRLSIVGDSATESDKVYREQVADEIAQRGLTAHVSLLPGIVNDAAPELYSRFRLYVNLTQTGSFDKTLFEAMSSGLLILTTNQALLGEIPERFIVPEGDDEAIIKAIVDLLTVSGDDHLAYSKLLREYVITNHSLSALIGKLTPLLRA